jgi:GYD domain
VRKLIEAVGGKCINFYFTTGDSDFLLISEANDAESIIGALVAAAAAGTISDVTTARAWTGAGQPGQCPMRTPSNQSPRSDGSALLLIEVLGWRNACGRRDTVAALTGAGVVLINDDRPGRGIGPGGVRTQRVEACFLLVAKPVVEFRECGLYAHHRTVRCFERFSIASIRPVGVTAA